MPTSDVAAAQSPSSLTALIHDAAIHAESPISTEALSTKQVASYIRLLSNFSLSDLRNQPQQLRSKSEALHQQLSELCISQTDAFIDIHQAEQQFAPSLDTLATHLGDLISNTLPDLQKAAHAFTAASKPILEQRQRVQNVAEQYERGHLSDLLEIPPLVHTCVQAAHYSEAIQLTEHLIGLLKPSQATASHIKPAAFTRESENGQRNTYLSLLIETLSHLASMKADLIASFSRNGLKLPPARKSINVLRKLNHVQSLLTQIPDWSTVLASPQANTLIPELGLTENQLCLAFLKARIRSFHSALDAMGSPSSFSSETYLRRYIDLWRDEMADTLSMAFALFIDDTPSPSNLDSSSGSKEGDIVTPSFLVSSFASSGLERLRDTVSLQLGSAAQRSRSSSDSGALETLAELFSSVHTQLSYASVSLSRFGFDFGRLLFTPIHPSSLEETASLSTIEKTWLEALSFSLVRSFTWFDEQLDSHLQSKDPALPSSWLISIQLPSSAIRDLYTVTSGDSSTNDDLSRPNIELVDYPLFARLLNSLLNWMNAVQVFAPTSIAELLVKQLDSQFARLSERLLNEVSPTISRVDRNTSHADKFLADDESQSLVQHLDEETRERFRTELVKDRESVILGRVVRMWHQSVASWTLRVVQERLFDLKDAEAQASEEVWSRIQEWISTTTQRVVEADRRRLVEAKERKRVVEEARAKAKEEQQEERRKAEQEAMKKAEEEAKKKKAEQEARLKAEQEAKKKAEEEEARNKAEAEAKAKAEEEARIEAEEERKKAEEEEARRKTEEEARMKAEAEKEAKERAEAEARAKAEAARVQAEAEAEAKAKEEARTKAEEERSRVEAEAEVKAKAEQEARMKQEAEVRANEEAEAARVQVETEARKQAEAEAAAKAKAEAEEEAQNKAEEEAAREKAEDEACKTAEVQARKKAEAEAKIRADEEAAKAKEAAEAATNQEPTPTAPQQATSATGASKKFSLAEKLRQRKEERDRAAAAATAAGGGSNDRTEAQATEDVHASEDVKEVVADTAPSKDESAQPDEVGEVEASEAVEKSANTEAEEKANAEEGDEEEEEQDKDSGANTPTTPATPTTPNLGGNANAGGKKKNKKKKKK